MKMNVRGLVFAALLLALAPLALAAEALYPPVSRASADIEAALKQAAASGKRVLVDFGGNWCPDCKVLDINLRKPEAAALLEAHYVLVHVNVGDKGITDNFEIAERYGIPLKKGVPALAVLDGDGRVIHAQKSGEFESMRKVDPQAVADFLKKWRR
jgi:thiol:disulfide interchange protein